MNAPRISWFDRFTGAFYIFFYSACEPTNRAVPDNLGHRLHGFKVAVTGNRKTGLDNINLHRLQGAGNTNFFVPGHRRARALFAVAKRGVEYD